MIVLLVAAVAVALAAVYLLRPLGRRALVVPVLLGICAAAAAAVEAAAAAPASPAPPGVPAAAADPAVGLLLLAIDAHPDHLRVSEALRLSNAGPLREVALTFPLPDGAVYLTVHRAPGAIEPAAGGFRARLRLPAGLSELAFSYAVPAGRTAALVRAYPLPVRRMEVVARGRGVGLRLDRGGPAAPVVLDGETLPRWEARALAAGAPITAVLDGLPVSRPWPAAGAGILAAVLAAGLIRHLHRGGDALRGGGRVVFRGAGEETIAG